MNARRLLPTFVLSLCLAACGGSTPPAEEATASAAPVTSAASTETSAPTASAAVVAPPAAPIVQFYKGTSTGKLANGTQFDGGAAFVKRTVDQASGTITEQAIHPGRPGEKGKEFIVTMKVDGSKFAMTEANHAFEGDGTLTGDAWKWTAWTSHSKLPGDMTVDSSDSVVGTGLQSDKVVKDGKGATVVTMHETYEPTDADSFEKGRTLLLDTVTPGGPGGGKAGPSMTAQPAKKKP